jgi:hypothetical protein
LTPNVCGPQQAVVDVELDGTILKANRVHEATVRFVANDNQKLSAKVLLEVRRPDKPPVAPSMRPILIGAVAGCVFRLVLALPADVCARVLAAPAGASIPPGSFSFWLRSPLEDASFMRHFVLATWWLGAIVGAFLLWRRSHRATDVAAGVVTGAAAGLVGSATLALLLPDADGAARFLWQEIGTVTGWSGSTGAVWLWITVWILLATGTWTILGAGVGFLLGIAGRRGQWMLVRLQEILWTLFSLCRLDRAAAWIAR